METMAPYKKSELLKALLKPVGAKAASWNGIVYRAVGTEYANKRDLLSGESAFLLCRTNPLQPAPLTNRELRLAQGEERDHKFFAWLVTL